MDNSIIEFVIRGKDMLSSMFPPIARNANTSFAGMNNTINQTQNNLTRLSNPVRLNIDTSNLTDASRQIDQVTNSLNNMGMGKMIGGMAIGNMAASGMTQAANFVKDQIMQSLNAGLDASAMQAQFEVLAGTGKGNALFAELTKYIQDSVFGPELYKNATTMMAFGIAPDDVMKDMRMLGDVAMGNAEKMGLLTLAFSQTRSAGKLMGQDLLQYINAGFNPLMVLAEKTGKKYADLKDAMSEGKISADMVQKAFELATSQGGKFYGMLDKMALTPFGMKQAMEGSLEGAKMGMGIQELGAMTQVMTELRPLVNDLPRMLAQVKPELDTVIYGLADLVKWTRANTDTISRFFGLVKVGVEAYAAWKIATVGMAAANWAWNASMASTLTQTGLMVTEEQLLTAELLEQTAAVEANQVAWMTMSAQQLAALDAVAAKTATVTMGVAGASGIGAGAGMLGAGLLGGLSSVAMPVIVTAFVGQALDQMFGTDKLKNGDPVGFFHPINEILADFERIDDLKRRDKLRDNPVPTASMNPYSWDALVGQPKGLNSMLLDKYGIKMPTSGTGTKTDLGSAIDEIGSSITGGGKRQTVINIHNIVENMYNEGKTTEDVVNIMVPKLAEALAEVLVGVR